LGLLHFFWWVKVGRQKNRFLGWTSAYTGEAEAGEEKHIKFTNALLKSVGAVAVAMTALEGVQLL
jgi:hypothetical protein